jgi:hypothetical protein
MAQNSQVVQVKAFSENLNPYPNLVLSINKGDYVNLNEKGIVFVNLSGSDIPIQSINLQNESLEVASWNLSKGILEVTIRKKSYIDKKVRVVNENGDSVSALEVQFSGNKKLVKTTDSDGVIRIPLALNENIKGKNQFTISGYDIREYFEAPIAILHIKKIEQAIEQVESKENEKSADISAKTIKSRLSTEQIDSISSLRVFYDLINKTPRYEVDNTTQLKLDAKFNELLSKINTGSKSDNYDLLNQISDSTVVEEDIDKLLQKARIDNANMAEQKVLEEKIQLVRDKLNVGFENMTDDSKENLLNEIQQLESILESNKSEFNTNLNTYLAVINELKRRFFDLQELESRLSESERERLKEKKIYQERLLMTLGVVLLFAFLIILLFYLRSKLKKQQRKLIDANKVVKSTNENL